MKHIFILILSIILFSSCEKVQWGLPMNNPSDTLREVLNYETNTVLEIDSTMFKVDYHILGDDGTFINTYYSNRTNYIVISIENLTGYNINCQLVIDISSNYFYDGSITYGAKLSFMPYEKIYYQYDESAGGVYKPKSTRPNYSLKVRNFPKQPYPFNTVENWPPFGIRIIDEYGNIVTYTIKLK
jgi:hypothetical protein